MIDDYEQDINYIRSFCQAKDLDDVNQTMLDITKKWSEINRESYLNLLRAACDEIASCEFNDKPRAQELLEKYATLGLSKADNTQMDVQLHLLVSYLRLERKLLGLKVSDFPKERSSSANLWLDVWNKLEDLIDKNWNLNDPQNDVKPFFPQTNEPFISGMLASDLKDPKLREEYEKHIEKNKEISAKNKLQVMLRKVKAEYSQQVVDYLANLYSMPPLNNQELKEKLARLKDEDMKKKILAAMSAKERTGGR